MFTTTDMSRPLQIFSAAAVIPGLVLTSFAVLPDGSQIALGFSNGTVTLFSGNFLKEFSSGKVASPQILLQNHPCPVSGLHFCQLPSVKPNERRIRLFVVFDTAARAVGSDGRPPDPVITGPGAGDNPHDAGILVLDTSVSVAAGGTMSMHRRPPHALDELGGRPGCSSIMKGTRELLIARGEGVFCYSVEDRGGASGFEGEKQGVSAVGRYVGEHTFYLALID